MKKLNVLVGFEESQTICKAFRAAGHLAYSCDLQECSGGRPEWHLLGDFFKVVKIESWDLIIIHPPCTYTALSGNRWYAGTRKRENGALLCARAWRYAKKYGKAAALEQPMTMVGAIIGKHTQVIHPWQFGHGEKKETWLWLHNLPKLQPTKIVSGRVERVFLMPPGPDRSKLRSKTYEGVANAMVKQWHTF